MKEREVAAVTPNVAGDIANQRPRAVREALLIVALLAACCGGGPLPSPARAPEEPPGDPEKGKALLAGYECNRCHQGAGLPEATVDRACFACHAKVVRGEIKGPNGEEARWRERVLDLTEVPSLTASRQRLRRAFVEGFLTEPFDLRPRLMPTMPRLPLTRAEVRHIAAYLTAPDDDGAMQGGDPARGRALVKQNGCASCHGFSGLPLLEGAAPVNIRAGPALAPDHRHTRVRSRPEEIVGWLRDPRKVKPDMVMAEYELSLDDARDIAAYLLGAALSPLPPYPTPPRLALPAREVGFDEVSAKVFLRTCWHCHGEPDDAAGDGGPGNTGGFGFKPRGVSLVSYASVLAGRLDDNDERHSLFEETDNQEPRLLRSLLARRQEEAGHPDPLLRGMPLGYPSLTPEDVQLVEAWIAQGRPR